MFGNFEISDMIAIQLAAIDIRCRTELRNRLITSERDYVSTLSTRIRDYFNVEGRGVSCYAQTLPQGLEIENGVDGLILFQYDSEVKIGWYEAKWPRVGQVDYPWDRIHPTRNISHFSEQIIKQHRWSSTLAEKSCQTNR